MFEIIPYSKKLDESIDRFVNQESVNGTFLQSRAFLNYHPQGRFKEASFILHKSGTMAAYFPGVEQEGQVFVSHSGSTFGGPIIGKPFYRGSRIFELLQEANTYLTSRYKKIVLKITPALFAQESPDLLEYTLEHLGYKRHTELSSQTPLNPEIPVEELCEKNQRKVWRDACKYVEALPQEEQWEFRPLEGLKEFETFYHYLLISKAKHKVKPVHSLEEILDLKNRLPQNIRFRSLWFKKQYVSSIMDFIFPKTKVLHHQYVASNEEFKEFHHTTTLYMLALKEALQEGFKHMSWGISTENHGEYLNQNLLHYKESFGAKPVVNVTYVKQNLVSRV